VDSLELIELSHINSVSLVRFPSLIILDHHCKNSTFSGANLA
jgi:hypothetical protein